MILGVIIEALGLITDVFFEFFWKVFNAIFPAENDKKKLKRNSIIFIILLLLIVAFLFDSNELHKSIEQSKYMGVCRILCFDQTS